MAQREKLTEKLVRAAEPRVGIYQVFDEDVRGFSLRVFSSGSRHFALDYRVKGRQRRFTIGRWPEWTVTAAREQAKALRRIIDDGGDPLGERETGMAAPRIPDLIDRYIETHTPNLAPTNRADQISMLRKLVQPVWKHKLVEDITLDDVDRLLSDIAKGRARPSKAKPNNRARKLQGSKPTPIRANRTGEVLRKMFSLAVQWKLRPDNPAMGFHRRIETERERYLSMDEIDRLAKALGKAEDQRAASIIRMCMLTGGRLGEVRCARFEQFNLEFATWSKPATATKQRKVHRLPISPDVAAIVRQRQTAVYQGCPWLFPGDVPGQPVKEIRRFWRQIQTEAGISGVRIHDLRHTFASLLVSGGASLEMIGKLLGHSQMRTTQRYAHMMDSPLRDGVNAVAEMMKPQLRVLQGGVQGGR
ncbi:MAG: site-specific integrase [Paracoccaceae bacterium]|nr:site-specific integrase [Paracoccaceae bacterium]